MKPAMRKIGDWAKAREILAGAPGRLRVAARQALLQEAQALRNDIVRGITSQAPGGEAFTPLAPLTLAARRMKGTGGTKALIARADLRNSIGVITDGDEVFVGVLRSAQSASGDSLVDIATIHEFGAGPTVIPMTPAMRRFLFALFKSVGISPRAGAHGGGAGVIVVQIPPRPFLRPAFRAFQTVAPSRFLRRVARAMRLEGE
jgi:hypothetical protein